jgi:hypothetical protein
VKIAEFPSSNANCKAILSKSQQFTGTTATGLNQWSLRALNANQFNFMRASGGAPAPVVTRADAVGAWTLVTYVRPSVGTHNMRVYNAAAAVATATSTGADAPHADVDVYLGGFAGTDGNGIGFFSGQIDEVRVSNTARSDAWLDLEFANQRPTGQNLVSPDTLIVVGLTEATARAASASVLVKSSGNGLSFTIHGAPGARKASLTLTDMRGRSVWSRSTDAQGGSVIWDARDAQAGIYALQVRITDADGKVMAILYRKVPLTR